jgi:hypothetical protein
MFKFIVIEPSTQHCVAVEYINEYADQQEQEALKDYLKHEYPNQYVIKQKDTMQ